MEDKDELLKMAERLEGGYIIKISALNDIAEAVAMLLRLAARSKAGARE